MTPEILRELIAQGETLEVEFKSERRAPLSDRDLVEAVVCLSNRPGRESGWLILGVEDDGRITGAQPRSDHHRLEGLLASRTRPSLSCRVSPLQLEAESLLVIEVPTSLYPVSSSDGKYLKRVRGGDGKPECRPLEFHEMQAMLATRGAQDYSALLLPDAAWTDLDPLEFVRFRRLLRESGSRGDPSLLQLDDLELARALGAVTGDGSDQVRLAGLLLFGLEPSLRQYLPTHEVAFQAIEGTQVTTNEIFRLPLLHLAEELLARYRARVRQTEVELGMVRLTVPDFSESAFREAVANAISHRDYSRLGAVHVQWFQDRLEVSNPGGFPEGVHLGNLLTTPPRPRNPLLVDALKRVGLVERTARGVDTIFVEQLRYGRPAPSYDRSSDTDVVLVLPGGASNLEFVRLVHQDSNLLGLDQLLLLNRLYETRQLTSAEAAKLLQRSESEARNRLQNLLELGLVEARGERKGRSYHLSSATYRRLGQPSAYVRQKGFTPLQQEQMVLQYVQSHGSINRAEVAELCQISLPQAYRLLQRLLKNQQLETEGQGRGVRYRLKKAQKHTRAISS